MARNRCLFLPFVILLICCRPINEKAAKESYRNVRIVDSLYLDKGQTLYAYKYITTLGEGSEWYFSIADSPCDIVEGTFAEIRSCYSIDTVINTEIRIITKEQDVKQYDSLQQFYFTLTRYVYGEYNKHPRINGYLETNDICD